MGKTPKERMKINVKKQNKSKERKKKRGEKSKQGIK